MSTASWHGVGVALPCIDAFGHGAPVLEVAREAERVGLDHVWAPDHLVFHRPVLETLSVLSAVAGATQRVGLGSAILNLVLRDVTWLAKQLASLEVLAPGRLLLGVGLGGEYEPEFRAAGIDKRERGRRLDEALHILPPLLRGEAVTHEGLLRVDCDGLAPVGSVPPVLVGGRSDAALRRAARFADAWLPMWMDPGTIRDRAQQLDGLADEFGRPSPGVALVGFVNVCDDLARGRAQAAEMIRHQYGMPFEKVERWTLLGSVDAVAERLADYRDAGVAGFSLSAAHPDPVSQVELLADVRRAVGLDLVSAPE